MDDIISCIDQERIEVGTASLEPRTNRLGKISGANAEDSTLGEWKIFFDIKFPVYCKKEQFKVIINIEAQRSTDAAKLGYHLENRIIYYLARMISSQKNVEFFNSDYDNIKKVYSIWICMDAAVDGDSIEEFEFVQRQVFGHQRNGSNLDKMQAVIIRIRRRDDVKESKHKLISMLEVLLSKEQPESKKRRLVDEHGMKMSVDLDRRLGTMCNISDVIVEEAIEEGLAKGMAQGMKQGMAQGMAQGMEKGLEQGLEQGVEQTLKKIVCKMLQLNQSIADICAMTECEPEYVEAIKKSMQV